MRQLTSHIVNPCNDKITISVLDEPGSGGANHLYDVRGFDTATNASDPFKGRYGKSSDHSTIIFQNGPIPEVGTNGVTHEVLLAILIDRVQCFQSGKFACNENMHALIHLTEAQKWLQSRTLARMARNVEGTHRV